jgi:bifunctional DNA-binding transcriptional regulator/antitoxin component of YhaV-PrlF toxin-antitoxin module
MQVTIPVAFRRKHHPKPGDKAHLEVMYGTITLTPYRAVIEDLAGSLSSRGRKERR